MGSTVVIPAPAVASSNGPSDGCTEFEHVTGPRLIVQIRGDLPIRGTVHPDHPTHGDLQSGERRRGHRVLPGLTLSVRQIHEHRHVLARADRGQLATVCRFQDQGDHVVGFLDPPDQAIGP
jgi:hypothetical protein